MCQQQEGMITHKLPLIHPMKEPCKILLGGGYVFLDNLHWDKFQRPRISLLRYI